MISEVDMISYYYPAAFIISLILTITYAYRWHKHFVVYFTLTFTLIPLVNLGYVLIGRATGLEEALIAQRIIYLGGCFLIYFLMLGIFKTSHGHLHIRLIISRSLYGYIFSLIQHIYYALLYTFIFLVIKSIQFHGCTEYLFEIISDIRNRKCDYQMPSTKKMEVNWNS